MTTPLFHALGLMGTGPLVSTILRVEGNFRIPWVDLWEENLVHFAYVPAVHDGAWVSLSLSLEKYRAAWKKVRETMAPGPSGTRAHR